MRHASGIFRYFCEILYNVAPYFRYLHSRRRITVCIPTYCVLWHNKSYAIAIESNEEGGMPLDTWNPFVGNHFSIYKLISSPILNNLLAYWGTI